MYDEAEAMMDTMLEQAANDARTMGRAVVAPKGLRFQRPIDVVRAAGLSVENKRAVLASWASDFYAVESRPALRLVPELGAPISIDEVQSALKELDRLEEARTNLIQDARHS